MICTLKKGTVILLNDNEISWYFTIRLVDRWGSKSAFSLDINWNNKTCTWYPTLLWQILNSFIKLNCIELCWKSSSIWAAIDVLPYIATPYSSSNFTLPGFLCLCRTCCHLEPLFPTLVGCQWGPKDSVTVVRQLLHKGKRSAIGESQAHNRLTADLWKKNNRMVVVELVLLCGSKKFRLFSSQGKFPFSHKKKQQLPFGLLFPSSAISSAKPILKMSNSGGQLH